MDEAGAIWVPSPNHYRGRQGHQPRWIILHGTAGFADAAEVAAFFQQASTEASTHYIVARDGRLFQLVREADAAWGNGKVSRGHDPWWSAALNPNYLTISIEHHKLRRDNGDPLTEAQKRASFALIAHICARHGIPRRRADARGGITGHFSVNDPRLKPGACPQPQRPGLQGWLTTAHCPGGQQSLVTGLTLPPPGEAKPLLTHRSVP